MPHVRKPAAVLAATGALMLALAGPAAAADTLEFWNGVSTSGQCGAATFLGSQKIDNPLLSGIQQAGTIEKYRRTCSYPTSANQTCYNTRAKTFVGSTVKAGVTYRSPGGYQYWLMDQGLDGAWISSPVICQHMVDGSAWGAWSAVDGITATLFT